ncbi:MULTISPECIES: helix-turn-helix domain-containing protein [Vibrio]|uniref:helix-turn-helix domain-containing protein n=1 Tax=Vibrio TaxID=662 RepID=UPI000619B105|nr:MULTISPECIES: helix-turn-helix transcriptional regulator [Vibrio]
MTIRINLDIMMAKRKMRLKILAKEVEITEANLSVLKNGKAKAVRLSTLDKLCEVLECQPGDILEFEPNDHQDSVAEE